MNFQITYDFQNFQINVLQWQLRHNTMLGISAILKMPSTND